MIVEFNAFHPASNEMFEWESLKIVGKDNTVEHETEGVFTTDLDDYNHLILLPFTGAIDHLGNKLFLGDIFTNKDGSFYMVSENKHGGFYGVSNRGDRYGPYHVSLLPNTPYDFKNNLFTKRGNKYQNPKLFPKTDYND
jgi:hypothetical protein